MDGIHDLGGKQGFGPIPIGDDQGFHHDWECRMWAIARAGVAHGITIDWFRHGLERMVPTDYLTFNYFNKWCANYTMLLIDNQAITMDEALAGHVDEPGSAAPTKSLDDVLAANRGGCVSFALPQETAPVFNIGDMVTTKRAIRANHTRLPAYASDATGIVIAYHGAHGLPDKGAQGVHEGEHLYTVAFKSCDLWGPECDPRDEVTLELWESYFV